MNIRFGSETVSAATTAGHEVRSVARFVSWVLFAQGAYYLVAGLWPILHMRSFVAVSGPKWDLWLVVTVGALLSVIGGALLLASFRRGVAPEMWLLALGTPAALIVIDVYYASIQRIWPVYLADALLEIIIFLALIIGLFVGAYGNTADDANAIRTLPDESNRMARQKACRSG